MHIPCIYCACNDSLYYLFSQTCAVCKPWSCVNPISHMAHFTFAWEGGIRLGNSLRSMAILETIRWWLSLTKKTSAPTAWGHGSFPPMVDYFTNTPWTDGSWWRHRIMHGNAVRDSEVVNAPFHDQIFLKNFVFPQKHWNCNYIYGSFVSGEAEWGRKLVYSYQVKPKIQKFQEQGTTLREITRKKGYRGKVKVEAGQNAEDKHAACFFVNMMGIQVGISIWISEYIIIGENMHVNVLFLKKWKILFYFLFMSLLKKFPLLFFTQDYMSSIMGIPNLESLPRVSKKTQNETNKSELGTLLHLVRRDFPLLLKNEEDMEGPDSANLHKEVADRFSKNCRSLQSKRKGGHKEGIAKQCNKYNYFLRIQFF